MADLLEQASQWLDDQRRRFLSRLVIYGRGEVVQEVLATVGKTEFEITDDYGIVQQWQSRDFLISAEDMVAFGLPERGDRIIDMVDGKSFVYEVLAPAGRTPWRWSDGYRRTLRIHTKEVA